MGNWPLKIWFPVSKGDASRQAGRWVGTVGRYVGTVGMFGFHAA